MTGALVVWDVGSAKAQCVVTVPAGTTIASNFEVGCSSPTGQTASPTLNPGQATGANNASVSVTGVSISQPAGGQPRNGIAATTTGTGGGTVTVTDTTITNIKTTGPSLGINITVNPANSTAVADGVLTMSGTNSITIGQFDPITGLPTTPGSGGGILVNVRGAGNATTTIGGTLDVNVFSGTGSGSIAKDDGVETTARGGTATLDMTGITGASTVSTNAGNGLFIDSLPSTPNTSGGNVVVVGVSNLVAVNVDNSTFGVANPSTTTAVANAGILAATFGSGTVNIQGTSATINTTGPFADGIHAITQTGTVTLNNSGNITTTGPSSHGIEVTTTNVTPTLPIYTGTAGATTLTTVYNQQLIAVSGMPDLALSGFPATGAVSVTNSGAITTSGGGSATTASNGIYAWTLSGGTGASGNVTVVNNAGGNVTASGDFSNAILATTTNTSTGAAGAINVTNAATLTTFGANADGISAIASGTTVGPMTIANSGVITVTGASANGMEATTSSGVVTIDNSGSVNSGHADGILASATAAGATLALINEAAGNIFGSTGVGIGNNFATAQLDNAGTIGASTDLAIDSTALTTGPLTINNSGTITGFMRLGAGVNTLNNSGTWNFSEFQRHDRHAWRRGCRLWRLLREQRHQQHRHDSAAWRG